MEQLRDIADALSGSPKDEPRLRKGVVTSGGGTSSRTVQVSIGGAASRPVEMIGQPPENNAVIWVVEQGPVAIGLWSVPEFLRGDDTRNTEETPLELANTGVYDRSLHALEFKSGLAIGLPGSGASSFYGVITLAPWSDDSGGGMHQLAFGNLGAWWRTGSRGGGWDPWARFLGNDQRQWHYIGASGEPAFQNGWGNYGGGWQTARYRMDGEGYVHMQGLIAGGASASVAFTLPAGWRPANHLIFPIDVNPTEHGRLDIANNGPVTIHYPNARGDLHTSLSGVCWLAEQ